MYIRYIDKTSRKRYVRLDIEQKQLVVNSALEGRCLTSSDLGWELCRSELRFERFSCESENFQLFSPIFVLPRTRTPLYANCSLQSYSQSTESKTRSLLKSYSTSSQNFSLCSFSCSIQASFNGDTSKKRKLQSRGTRESSQEQILPFARIRHLWWCSRSLRSWGTLSSPALIPN